MQRLKVFAWVIMVALFTWVRVLPSQMTLAVSPQLSIREIKITGNEFVVLQNTGSLDIAHLSDYWLGYVSNDSATAPPVQQLPDVALMQGAVILLSDGSPVNTCDASIVGSLNPSLSDTKGTLSLWDQTNSNFTQLAGPQAVVKWNKSTSTFTVPAGEIDLKNQSSQYANPVWFYDSSHWVLGDFASCVVTEYDSSGSTLNSISWPSSDSMPPAIIVSLASSESSGSGIPSTDIGLAPPQITELLPNPAGTGTDDTDEFIELYNPNNSDFDLNGFTLEVGLTTKHKFTFDDSTVLPAKSFTAFYSADTNLNMSNTGGQAFLLDPLGNVINQTDQYPTAKDGQAWVLANGKWYWTNTPTPGAVNVVNQGGTSNSKTTKSSSNSGSVKGDATSTGGQANFANSTAQATPVHGWTIAGVGGAALLYAGYEYRNDLSNNIYRIRRYLAARRAAGK